MAISLIHPANIFYFFSSAANGDNVKKNILKWSKDLSLIPLFNQFPVLHLNLMIVSIN